MFKQHGDFEVKDLSCWSTTQLGIFPRYRRCRSEWSLCEGIQQNSADGNSGTWQPVAPIPKIIGTQMRSNVHRGSTAMLQIFVHKGLNMSGKSGSLDVEYQQDCRQICCSRDGNDRSPSSNSSNALILLATGCYRNKPDMTRWFLRNDRESGATWENL